MTDDGVRVVGAPASSPASTTNEPGLWHRWRLWILAVIAAAGMLGTIGFGIAWAELQSRNSDQTAAQSVANRFLNLLTNFDAKTVDSDFNQIDAMGTGQFAQQAKVFFNSRIRSQLQAAQASTRGQIRYLYLQSFGNDQASFYGLVDQTYANSASKGPAADELRLVVDLTKANGQWKVSAVTDLGSAPVSVSPPSTTP